MTLDFSEVILPTCLSDQRNATGGLQWDSWPEGGLTLHRHLSASSCPPSRSAYGATGPHRRQWYPHDCRRDAEASIKALAAAEGFALGRVYVEVETGKGSDAIDRRPQLAAAHPQFLEGGDDHHFLRRARRGKQDLGNGKGLVMAMY
jgi:hypothetical protein